jgi:protein-tyrosine phosphatase
MENYREIYTKNIPENHHSGYRFNTQTEKYNYFIEGKAIFGAYPTQLNVNHLESLGVRYFLDLTVNHERGTEKYCTRYNYENYPIHDRDIPNDTISFAKLIVRYADIISHIPCGELVYIHCRGGHGRSGMLSTCILIFLYKMLPAKAIETITEYHITRPCLSSRWKRINRNNGKKIEPFIRVQKMFIYYFFKPIYMFLNSTPTKCLYEFCRDIVYGQINTKNRILELFEGNNENNNEKNNENINDLLSTGLKPIIFNYSNEGKGISKILMEIRLKFLMDKIEK